MATMLETPSRIWRRIEAIEHRDMPSLPSLPPFEDSEEVNESQEAGNQEDEFVKDVGTAFSPLQSTPTTQYTMTSTNRGSGNTVSGSSTTRFANSIASRSNKSSSAMARRSREESFEVPSLPAIHPAVAASDSDEEGVESKSSVPDVYLPPGDDDEQYTSIPDFSLADALESVSREGSPFLPEITREDTPKNCDHSVSLNSEPKPSPLEKYRHVALRRTNPRARTPSLSRTSSSGTSSPTHSTPRSIRSPVSQSHGPSPVPSSNVLGQDPDDADEHDLSRQTQETRSMDITDVHISPPRLDGALDDHADDVQPIVQEPEASHDQDAHEPTFSSEGEGEPTPYVINSKGATINTSNMRSPSPSIAFTPTPALPRQRARFNLPPPPSDLLSTPIPELRSGEDNNQTPRREVIPATPYNRPSFLLSVINSTARPRMTAGTPHPKKFGTPSMAESTPAASVSSNTSASATLRPAFATVSRRPRIALAPRMSHPLSGIISGGASSESEVASPVEAPWATPSPYDGTVDKASFISTASSHDLTTQQRVNTSFDPAMGFGPGAPVGRFNANKLNTYLHGLNKRLQEENEVLVGRLKELEEEKKTWGEPKNQTSAENSGRCLSNPARRRSSIGTVLGDVKEDMAEEWLEEKVELEEMIEVLKEEVKNCAAEKEEVEKKLKTETEGRERDKFRWKERMQEAQDGVSDLLVSLERKVTSAEEDAKRVEKEASRKVKEMEKVVAGLEGERDIATERALKAEKLLEGGKELGSALAEANERIARIMGDLKNANLHVKGLEEEVTESDSRIDELEREVGDQKIIVSSLEDELRGRGDALLAERTKVKTLEDTINQLDEQLNEAKGYAEVMEQGVNDAGEQIHKLEDEFQVAQETINKLSAMERQSSNDIKSFERELKAAREREHQLEEAVEDAEERMKKDGEVIVDLRNRLASLERERQRDATIASCDTSRSPAGIVYTAAEYEDLEQELDEANKEKARLRALLDQSPARKAIEKAKDLKIELLEREKENLLERNRALRMTVNEIGTPSRVINASGISPIHRHVLSMSIRMPKTPGAPLKDLSWLNSTQHDSSVTPLVSEIQRLQGELDRANESIDDKLDKLENAGLDVVSLTQNLEDAQSKIIALEDDITSLKRREERRTRRLTRARCPKCHIKLDLDSKLDESSISMASDNLPREPPTPPTRTSEALKANLQAVNDHLEELKKQWEAEKSRLLGEKAVLQDAAHRLNSQIRDTKSAAKKASAGAKVIEAAKSSVQDELNKAKETIAVLERELSSERSRLRSLVAEQERMQREKKQILTDMQRTESDIDEVKHQMLKLKKENQNLEQELRENATVEQKARLLQTRVAENAHTIEQLRQERSLLASEHKDLQRRFKHVTDDANNLRNKCSSLSTAHDDHRHELDMHRQEIDDLRKTLEDRANDLQRMEQEKERVASEKDTVARTVAALEADLQRVKRDAEAFGKDLKTLRAEKEKLEVKSKEEIAKAERAKKQAQAQIRILNEQLNVEKEKMTKATELFENRVLATVELDQVSQLKVQHNKECKGLIVQIRYLQAKFIRESLFREDLTYQKHYLLVLLQQFERSEQNIFASIARIGFPVFPPPLRERKPKLKSIACAIVFLARIKKSSNVWRQDSACKKQVVAALDDVRKRRAANLG